MPYHFPLNHLEKLINITLIETAPRLSQHVLKWQLTVGLHLLS